MTHTDLIARMKARTFLDLGESWTKVLRDHHDAADALTAAQERIEALEEALRDVIEMWDWCSEDPYDRGYGPVSDAVYNARAALDATGKGEG